MSISYPLNLPTTLGLERFAWTAFNAVGMLRSPFTYALKPKSTKGSYGPLR